jgi:hypothetical protein
VIKRYCDICGNEVPVSQPNELLIDHTTVTSGGGRVRLQLKIIRAIDGTWNSGDCCNACIRVAAEHGEVTS